MQSDFIPLELTLFSSSVRNYNRRHLSTKFYENLFSCWCRMRRNWRIALRRHFSRSQTVLIVIIDCVCVRACRVGRMTSDALYFAGKFISVLLLSRDSFTFYPHHCCNTEEMRTQRVLYRAALCLSIYYVNPTGCVHFSHCTTLTSFTSRTRWFCGDMRRV
jgi:hypothetical protein